MSDDGQGACTPEVLARVLAALRAVEGDHDCALCGAGVPLEVLGCVDGHGDGCPDRVCSGCGGVVVLGPAPLPERRPA